MAILTLYPSEKPVLDVDLFNALSLLINNRPEGVHIDRVDIFPNKTSKINIYCPKGANELQNYIINIQNPALAHRVFNKNEYITFRDYLTENLQKNGNLGGEHFLTDPNTGHLIISVSEALASLPDSELDSMIGFDSYNVKQPIFFYITKENTLEREETPRYIAASGRSIG